MPSVPRLARAAAAALGLALPCLPATAVAAVAAADVPPPVSLATAKARAAREGKLVLVDFTAAWCAPCRLMEQTTFADPGVLAYLGEHYVSLRVDVDDFDGFALRQAYGVEALPTLLFLSSAGEEVARVAEGVGPTELLERLRGLNVPEHRRVVGGAASRRTAASEESNGSAARPTGPPPEHATPDAYVSPAAPPAPVLAREGDAGAAAGFAPSRTRFFSLQAGEYPNRGEAVRAAEELRDSAREAVLLEFDYAGGRPVYRLYVGRFADLREAEPVRERLANAGFELTTRELLTP